MAIYHLNVKIITRARGQSAVASAAYRSGSVLHDERLGQTFDFSYKRGVEHTEVLAPSQASSWVHSRETLWNTVEKAEKRKDAQLAREIELALPVELTKDQQVELLRDFAQRSFVSKGMVVDLALHRDNPKNPHAHLMLTLRDITPTGFGPKRRDWNSNEILLEWRQQWAEIQNEHLARAGPDIRVDHRTLEAQGLDLVPGRKIGISLKRQQDPELPHRVAERVAEQKRIARENGERILRDPRVALRALTHHQATFTDHDLAKWLNTRTDSADQFREAHLKLTSSPDLVTLGRDDRGRTRYTSREMLEVEKQLLHRASHMTARARHPVVAGRVESVLTQHNLSDEQQAAFRALTAAGDLKALVGVAGSGKSRLLAATREAWEAQGYAVKGAALSGIAAENLQVASGIESRTLASFEYAWNAERDLLTANDVLVIDEAGMIGTRQLGRMLEATANSRAKIVLVGDPEQLQAIEAGAAFRGIIAEHGALELNEIRRQNHLWQRNATRQMATGQTVEALKAYEGQGAIVQHATHAGAQSALIEKWIHDGHEHPDAERLMLAYTRADVKQLNELARDWRREHGELGRVEVIDTERGRKEIAIGERLYFLRNEKSLGVKNGTLGTVENIKNGVLQIRLDGTRAQILVDSRFYRDLDYGYAATVYKAQGSTVDHAYVLATANFDRHSTYVALSRHRDAATVFYANEDFEPPWAKDTLTPTDTRPRFMNALSRARPKELAHDFLDQDPTESIESMTSIEEIQQRAVQRWQEFRRGEGADLETYIKRVRNRSHSHHGPEEDLDL